MLDAQSRALVAQLHNAGPVKAAPAELGAMLARLEQSIVADTALNELRLRPQIRGLLAHGEPLGLEQLNARIYADVFHTPRADAWLGPPAADRLHRPAGRWCRDALTRILRRDVPAG